MLGDAPFPAQIQIGMEHQIRRLRQEPRAYDQNRGRKKVVNAHAGSRTRVTSMGGLYDAATLRALVILLGVGY